MMYLDDFIFFDCSMCPGGFEANLQSKYCDIRTFGVTLNAALQKALDEHFRKTVAIEMRVNP